MIEGDRICVERVSGVVLQVCDTVVDTANVMGGRADCGKMAAMCGRSRLRRKTSRPCLLPRTCALRALTLSA